MAHAALVLSIAIFLNRASCAAFAALPRATSVVDSHNVAGWTPRPTSGPLARRAYLNNAAHIFARNFATSATCGYITADAYNSITCGDGAGCGWFPILSLDGGSTYAGDADGYVQCVNIAGPDSSSSSWEFSAANPPTTCIDYNRHNNTGAGYSYVGQTMFCGSTAQLCATYKYIGRPTQFSTSGGADGGGVQTYLNYICSQISTIEFVYQTTTNSISSSKSVPASTSASTSVVHVAIPSTPVPPPPTSVRAATSSLPTATPSPSPSSSTNVGAIAGGTVGGVLGIAAIAALIAWLYLRHRKAKKSSVPEISTYSNESTTSYSPAYTKVSSV